jgi:hypothetical protein
LKYFGGEVTYNACPKLITGVRFADGIEVVARSAAPSGPSRLTTLEAFMREGLKR